MGELLSCGTLNLTKFSRPLTEKRGNFRKEAQIGGLALERRPTSLLGRIKIDFRANTNYWLRAYRWVNGTARRTSSLVE